MDPQLTSNLATEVADFRLSLSQHVEHALFDAKCARDRLAKLGDKGPAARHLSIMVTDLEGVLLRNQWADRLPG